MDTVKALLEDPVLRLMLAGAAGWLGKVAVDALVNYLHARGKTEVEQAEGALQKALGTEDKQDDAVAQMALDRAKKSAVFMESLADALDKHAASKADDPERAIK